MNILLLAKHLNTGGITSYLYSLSKGLIAQGVKVFLVSSGGSRQEDFAQLGVQLTSLDLNTKSSCSLKIWRSLKPLRQLIVDNQISIVHSHTRITQIIGTLLVKKLEVMHVTTCHGFFKPKFLRKLFPCWGQKTIAISSAVKDHLVNDFHVSEENVVVVPNGIDLSVFTAITDERKKILKNEYNVTGDPVIGIVARLSDVKGQDRLLEAFPNVLKKHRKATLLIVGEGPYQAKLFDIRDRLQLESSVIFLPIVNQPARMIGLLDVFVNPSYQEGLGLSVMEAQACGVPVVATDAGGVVSLIEDSQTGMLVTNNQSHDQLIQDLSHKICRLIENKDLYNRIKDNALNQAQKRYSLELMTQKTMEVYTSVLNI